MPAANDKEAGMERERLFNLWGWVLFVVCAGFFIGSAVRAGDGWMVAGSVIFLAACGVFLIPLVKKAGGE